MASFLDARAHDGVWLVRIEDIDPPRDIPGAGEHIIRTLARLGLASDEPVLWQHDRHEAYQAALDRLIAQGRVYGRACSRKEVARFVPPSLVFLPASIPAHAAWERSVAPCAPCVF